MNEEQIKQGREALIGLGWEASSIDAFARATCNRELKKQISKGLLPYLKRVVVDLKALDADLSDLINHIEDFDRE